jgi:dTDP-4-amino-4,6-dideoxygalactose transaminase
MKARINAALDSGSITMGDHGRLLEEELAALLGVKPLQVGVCNSGTSALEIMIKTWKIAKPPKMYQKYIVVPNNTFMATLQAVWGAGFKPLICPINSSLHYDLSSLLELLKTNHRGIYAVMWVHIGGWVNPAMETARLTISREYPNILFLEDASHSIGARSKYGVDDIVIPGRNTDGMAASMYATKVLTCGEGGFFVFPHSKLTDDAKRFRDNGKTSWHSERLSFPVDGVSARLSELNAIVGRASLHDLEYAIESRKKVASYYEELIDNVGANKHLSVFKLATEAGWNGYKFIVKVRDERGSARMAKKLMAAFEDGSIPTQGSVYRCSILHRLGEARTDEKSFGVGKRQGVGYGLDVIELARHFCLPLYPKMPKRDIERVMQSIARVIK